jgi:hypothetical protein
MLKRSILLAALLAGCAPTPELAPVTSAATPAPSPAAKVGQPGSGSYALAKAAAVGKPYRLEGRRTPGGEVTWKAFCNVNGASKVVTVAGGQVSAAQDVADDKLKYQAAYGDGLGEIAIDSDVVLDRAKQAGLEAYDQVLLLTAAEFTSRTGEKAANPVWRVERNSSSYAVNAVTGKRIF